MTMDLGGSITGERSTLTIDVTRRPTLNYADKLPQSPDTSCLRIPFYAQADTEGDEVFFSQTRCQ
jgi:hypothetical protein